MTLSLIATIENRLREARYNISTSVRLNDGVVADVAASRTYFSWKAFVILSQHIVIARYDSADVSDAEALFKSGFAFGRSVNRVPLPRGLQFGFIIIPVLVTERPSSELIAYVSKIPTKRWSLFELPTVVDPNSGVATYYKGRALWGGLYFSNMRRAISACVDNTDQER